MLFNSYEFIFIFLPVTLLGYYLSAKFIKNQAAKLFLIFASVCFYSYWDINNLPVLLASICVNYFFGRWLTAKKKKKVLAAVLLLICYFQLTINIQILLLKTLIIYLMPVLPCRISFCRWAYHFLHLPRRLILLTYTAVKPKHTAKAITCCL